MGAKHVERALYDSMPVSLAIDVTKKAHVAFHVYMYELRGNGFVEESHIHTLMNNMMEVR